MYLNLDPKCAPELPDMGARSVVIAQRGFHLWGSMAPGGTVATFADPVPSTQIWQACKTRGGLFQLTSEVINYIRNAGEGTLNPLPNTADASTPAGLVPASRSRRSLVQIEVNAADGSGERKFFMDCNQSICIVAQQVCVAWMSPPNSLDVMANTDAENQATRFARTGIVQDAFLKLALSRIEQPPGDNSDVVFTRHLFVPANTRGSIEIPPYATDVTIYQEPTLGTSSIMWTQLEGDPNAGTGSLAVAALPWILGARRTQQESVLPNATHLQTDNDPDFTRFFTLRFKVRP